MGKICWFSLKDVKRRLLVFSERGPGTDFHLYLIEDRKIKIVFFFQFKFQGTFHYDSQFWSNRSVYNLSGGNTGFDLQETKLPTNWRTSISKICLGMRIDNQLRFIFINKQADSLHSLITDGKYRNTSVGRNTWKLLIGSQVSLQPNCNKGRIQCGGRQPQSFQSKNRHHC